MEACNCSIQNYQAKHSPGTCLSQPGKLHGRQGRQHKGAVGGSMSD